MSEIQIFISNQILNFMKKLFALLFAVLLVFPAFSQIQVTGKIVDEENGDPLIGVSIYDTKSSTGVSSSLDGSFSLKLPRNSNDLTISYVGYTTKNITVTAAKPDLGTITLKSEAIGLKDVVVTSSIAIRRKTPVALSVIEPLEIQEKLSTQEFPEILKSTPSIYATKQGGGYGDSRVNLRGFESANIAVMINGVPMNDMEWGGVYWSNWAGLSDVTRSMQVQRGLGASKVAAPSVGGSINIVTKSTEAKKGGSASYSVGDHGYNKMSFNISTGLSESGWAITAIMWTRPETR